MQPLLKSISLKFRFWVFVSMLIVVYTHSYNLKLRYLRPWSIPKEALTPTGFIEYFLCNGLFRFVVPLLFLISGYLCSLRDHQTYKQFIKKRLKVLFIPYIFWSAAGMIFIYLLMMFPYTRNIILGSHVMPETNTRLIHNNYKWYDIIEKWLLVPVPFQLWFVRVLIIYNLAYPFIRWCIIHKVMRWIFFSTLIILWIITFVTLFAEGEGLLFFSLGIWIQKTNFDIALPAPFLNPLIWGIVFILLCTGKTLLAFKGYSYFGDDLFPLLSGLHKLAIFSGLVTTWYGSSRLAAWFMQKKWFVWLAAFSFIIYVMHAPAVAIFINTGFTLFHFTYGYRLLTFIFLPAVLIILSIMSGAIFRKVTPALYSIATGGRGLKHQREELNTCDILLLQKNYQP